MTLATHLYVHGPIGGPEVFARALADLTDRPGVATEDKASTFDGPGIRYTQTIPGQGLPAWLTVTYCPDGPLRPDGDACDDYCDPDDEEPYHSHRPAHTVLVDWDTAYGYKHNSEGCGHLHARLVAQLGTWLDSRGIAWSWRNEFTGEIWSGEDRYARLPDLPGGGEEASAWFTNIVLPAIAADVASGGAA